MAKDRVAAPRRSRSWPDWAKRRPMCPGPAQSVRRRRGTGIGKTALLTTAANRWCRDGVTVVTVRSPAG